MKVLASAQVQSWLTALPPQSKHRVRLALRGSFHGRGDIKALVGPLEGDNRLRVGGLRIIYHQPSSQEIHLDFAQQRDVV